METSIKLGKLSLRFVQRLQLALRRRPGETSFLL